MIPVRHLGLLLLLFAVTVAVRWPHIGRPMGKHHEFCTATALRVLTVWHQEGIASQGFNPATNFAGTANKHINNHASGSGQMVDAKGNYYYVSHPPLAYYLPYAVFGILHIEPDVVPLQVFNLIINLLCGWGIYLLARRLLPNRAWAGVLATVIYWFTPATLWFQSNVYMSDMLVQPFFIAALFFALKVVENPRPKWIALLVISCFWATYTTWFGLLVAGSLGLYFLWRSRKTPLCGYVIVVIMLSQVLALGLMVWQYSQITGFDAYWAELGHRFGLRGGLNDNLLSFVVQIATNYIANYGLLLLLLPVLVFFYSKWALNTNIKAVLFWALFPILLMHLLLADYTGHDFTTLYLAVPVSIAGAVAAARLLAMNHGKRIVATMVIGCAVSGIFFYTLANPYGDTSLKGDRYDAELQEGLLYQQEPIDAVLFVIGNTPSPEALWYAKRNVKQIRDEAQALEFLNTHKLNQGVLYERVGGGKTQRVKTLSL